jgi:hypothetical protein
MLSFCKLEVRIKAYRGVDLAGLSKVPGKTFHWEGSYEGDLNEAKTLKTDLNVFEHHNPPRAALG